MLEFPNTAFPRIRYKYRPTTYIIKYKLLKRWSGQKHRIVFPGLFFHVPLLWYPLDSHKVEFGIAVIIFLCVYICWCYWCLLMLFIVYLVGCASETNTGKHLSYLKYDPNEVLSILLEVRHNECWVRLIQSGKKTLLVQAHPCRSWAIQSLLCFPVVSVKLIFLV